MTDRFRPVTIARHIGNYRKQDPTCWSIANYRKQDPPCWSIADSEHANRTNGEKFDTYEQAKARADELNTVGKFVYVVYYESRNYDSETTVYRSRAAAEAALIRIANSLIAPEHVDSIGAAKRAIQNTDNGCIRVDECEVQ